MIVAADAASKYKDSDDWGLDKKSFEIFQHLSPKEFTIDLFACCSNKQVPRFYSKVMSPGSLGVNAFMYSWAGDYVYACPPVKLTIDVIRHIETHECQGVLIVPCWRSHIFWTILTEDGVHMKPQFTHFRRFQPTIRSGPWCDKGFFVRNKRPEMLSCYFDTSRVEISKLSYRAQCLNDGCAKCLIG